MIKTLKGEQEVGGGKGHCNQKHCHEQRHRGMKVPEDTAIQRRASGQHNQSTVCVEESDERKARTFR